MMDYSIFEQAERDTIFKAFIVNTDMSVGGQVIGAWLPFPCITEDVFTVLQAIGIDGRTHSEFHISHYESKIPFLSNHLHRSGNLNELNYLAIKLESLNPSDRMIFEAAVEAEEYTQSMDSLINLCSQLNCFNLYPGITDRKTLGEYNAEVNKDIHALAVARLEKSDNPADVALASYISDLENMLDAEKYGATLHEEEYGSFTKNGFLKETGEPFYYAYHGEHDVPQAYRVFDEKAMEQPTFADKVAYITGQPPQVNGNYYGPVKVEDVDLTDLVFKMHAYSGDHLMDAHQNLQTLSEPGGQLYLIMANSTCIYVAEAQALYHENSRKGAVWKKYPGSTDDVQAYVVEVSKREDGRAFGTLAEIDFCAQRKDITDNSIAYTGVTAVLKSSEEHSFTIKEWEGASLSERLKYQSWTSHYSPADTERLDGHLKGMTQKQIEAAKPISPEVFLTGHNGVYMAQAALPAPDMVRIPQAVARQLLLENSVDVYRLLPPKPCKLEEISAAYTGLNFELHREFAVKRSDRAALDRWCEQKVTAMLDRTHRTEPQKKHEMEL